MNDPREQRVVASEGEHEAWAPDTPNREGSPYDKTFIGTRFIPEEKSPNRVGERDGVWHKDGPIAQLRSMVVWAGDIGADPGNPKAETARKIARNVAAAADALDDAEQARDRAVEERDEAREWVARLLQLEIPPRNEPGLDDATKQAARESLAQWRVNDE